MAIRTISDAGGNWNTTAAWVEATVPAAGDDIIATATSGNLAITAAAACRSIDLTNYVGTLTHGAFTLNIGTSSAPASLVAVAFPTSGWTYTLGNVTTSAISLASTAASSIQTVDFGGKTLGNVSFSSATTSGYKLINNGFTTGATATVTLTQGTVNTNGINFSCGLFASNNSNVRTLTMGASTITISGTGTSWNFATTTGMTISSNTATVILSGATATASIGGSQNWNGTSVQMTGSGAATFTATGSTFANLTRTGTAVKTDSILLGGNVTISGIWTLTGNSILNRILVGSTVNGTTRTITVNTTVSASNADFQDITGAGTASWNLSAATGGSGDCQGNSGITFTTAASQTWSGTAAGNWSTNAWTSRVPLPQDNVAISSAFSGTPAVTVDMPRMGKNIDWSGSSGTPSMAISVTAALYGSLTLLGTMTWTGGSALSLNARSASTVTSNSVPIGIISVGSAPACNYTFTDVSNFNGTTQLVAGTITFSNNVNVATSVALTNSGLARTINLGSSVWRFNVVGAVTVWNVQATSGITLNAGTSSMIIASANASIRTFAGGNLTYYNLTYTVTSAGSLVISGSNTFNSITANGGRTITFTSGTTTTFSSAAGWAINGSSTSAAIVNSSIAGTQATVSCASGTITADFLNLRDSNATGGATWYAGSNTTNTSNNTGWIFSALGLEYWGTPV
jgi:hypothetical protein